MRTWVRAGVDRLCGRCGDVIRRGDPVLEIRFQFLNGPMLTKLRCRTCAGDPVPDLPPLEPRPGLTPTPMVKLRNVISGLPFDWRRAQAGPDREPGEER